MMTQPVTELLEIDALAPEPQEEWRRMLRFVGFDEDARRAAMPTVETLLKDAHAMVAETYAYLARVPETAAVLGWERAVDPVHLEERRRFFTVWLSRTLALDSSDEFAFALFRAGKYHAADGPRKIHTPEAYVSGSIGLMLSAFSERLSRAGLSGAVIGPAMSAWSRYLSAQLNQMLFGYRIALDMKRGRAAIRCAFFGRLRPMVDASEVTVHVEPGAPVRDVMRKLFNYFPVARAEALERRWQSHERQDSAWPEMTSTYLPRYGWRVLLNGRDLEYAGGFDVALGIADELSIFPPGR
jgi:molybdopterin converting factor small subunit